MKVFYILLTIAIIGIGINVIDVYTSDKTVVGTAKAIPAIKIPFHSFIAATGIVEPASKKVVVAAKVSGVVTNVFVQEGDVVTKGMSLFTLDDTLVKNKIAILKTQMRMQKAKVKEAKDQFQLLKEFKKVSPQMVTAQKYAMLQDKVEVEQTTLQSLQTQIAVEKKQLSFYSVFAPISGRVLFSKLTVGSYFENNSQNPLFILGSNKLNIKVSINEYDIYKFQKNREAIAFVRGNANQKIILKYLYTVPFVVAKTALTGRATERTDTRVLQVMYAISDAEKSELFTGEQLDVFVKLGQ